MYCELQKVNKRRNGENIYLLVNLATVEFLISCPTFFCNMYVVQVKRIKNITDTTTVVRNELELPFMCEPYFL